jgi:tight adherence protein B
VAATWSWSSRYARRSAVRDRLGTDPPAVRVAVPARVVAAVVDAGVPSPEPLARSLWAWWLVAGPVLAGAGAVTGAWAPALCGIALWVGSPLAAERATAGRRARLADAQVPTALDVVARSLRGGGTVSSAIGDAQRVVGPPLDAELATVTDAMAAGAALVPVLDGWVERSPRPAVRTAATVLSVAAVTGAAAGRAVDAAAGALRSRQEVAAEVRALTSQARYSALVIGVAPVVFLAGAAVVDPRVPAFLLGAPIGWGCLVGGLVLDAVGAWWMQRIVVTGT